MSAVLASSPLRNTFFWLLAWCAGLLSLTLPAFDSMFELARMWGREEYSHAPIILPIAAYLVYSRWESAEVGSARPAWSGVALFSVALALSVIGQLSLTYTLSVYALWLGVLGLTVSTLGWKSTATFMPALGYLLFAIPLPGLLYNQLSQWLQLISTDLGVWGVRMVGISVFQSGNIIDLGTFQLEVAEACSGLRYLFPLCSFGYLVAILYKGKLLFRWILVLSTVPIAVTMNCVRIFLTALSVEYFGIEVAKGFLHYFEGWLIFTSCLALLAILVTILNHYEPDRRSLLDRISFSTPDTRQCPRPGNSERSVQWIGILAVCVLSSPLVGTALNYKASIPVRDQTLVTFPLLIDDWYGREGAFPVAALETLNLTDYFVADYSRQSDPPDTTVNLYLAYHEAQHRGSAAHSPRACLPGSGWEIERLEVVTIRPHSLQSSNTHIDVNRMEIRQGLARQLVYYWFDQRGRNLTDEYLVKWYLFIDAISMKRTDGSMIRLSTSVPNGTTFAEADARLQSFLSSFQPAIQRHTHTRARTD